MEQKTTKRNVKKVATELDPALLRKVDRIASKRRLSRADVLRLGVMKLDEDSVLSA